MRRYPRASTVLLGALVVALLVGAIAAGWWALQRYRAPAVTGIAWQVDNRSVGIAGDWQRLGAHELLVQWSAVDDLAFVPGSGLPQAPVLPDWRRIAQAPWARQVILGLGGRFDEKRARAGIAELAEQSRVLARLPTPLNVVGWYFPVEASPEWEGARRLPALLKDLPRPLWISVYDSANIGARETADWVASWLPPDVGVFFQDGVGVYARTPKVAREYADALRKKLGRERVRIIVEAFRPVPGGFRPATADELRPQLAAYGGYQTYLFDGPHYVTSALVKALAR
ncbi:hypothetical protein CEY04_11715 [Achromobacter sp. HZ28]|nr:hypothetical protein CEY05_20265 [Achromobacter sp. HZ34]OWT79840.1 hypothetical protein CEY04_11715 [Achromobacter sp. HZ28]